MRLFTYRVKVDAGSAPNPFWDVCTLVICKPVIRRTAQVGDWIAGFGCKRGGDDRTRRVVYAMRVTSKMSMLDYDVFTRRRMEGKVLDRRHPDVRRRLGDSIYDFEDTPPRVRPGIHVEADRARDLRGENALLSTDYVYWGCEAPRLPDELLGVVPSGRAHQSEKNEPFKHAFVAWLNQIRRGVTGRVGVPLDWRYEDDRLPPEGLGGSASCGKA